MTTPGALRVRVRHASGLRAADKGGTSDPFVAITLGGLTEKTPVVKKTLNPQFDYDFVFNFEAMSSLEGEQMEVQVYEATVLSLKSAWLMDRNSLRASSSRYRGRLRPHACLRLGHRRRRKLGGHRSGRNRAALEEARCSSTSHTRRG
jgi:nicotinic acid phosphoribosyltransferase